MNPEQTPSRLQILRAGAGLMAATLLLASCAPRGKDPYETEIRDTARYIMGDMSESGFIEDYAFGDKTLRVRQELSECRPDDNIVQESEISGAQQLGPVQTVVMPLVHKIPSVSKLIENPEKTSEVRVVQRFETKDSSHDDYGHFDAELKHVDGRWTITARYVNRVLTDPADGEYDERYATWMYPESAANAIPLKLPSTKVLEGSQISEVLEDVREAYDEIRIEGACGTPPAVRNHK